LNKKQQVIREAVHADIPHLVVMGRHFLHASKYADHIVENPDAMFDLLLRLIDAEDGVVFVSGDDRPRGMIGAHLFKHPISGEIMVSELFWWVEPDHRGAGLPLMRALEDWARTRGAVKLQMVAPDDRTGRAYRGLGYTKLEEHFIKVL
jgi:GNAT superfamily N-acetyltransferase